MTEVESAQLIAMLVTAFPDDWRFMPAEQQSETRALYRSFLADLDYEAAKVAAVRLISTVRRMPRISELRGAIASQVHGRSQTALEAWGALRKFGNPQPAERWDVLDPVLRACLEHLGWVVRETLFRGGQELDRWRVVRGMADNEAADRARWVELYDQLAARELTDRTVGALAPPIRVRELDAGLAQPIGDIVKRLLPKGDS